MRWTSVGNRRFRRLSLPGRLVAVAVVVGGAGRLLQAATDPSQVLRLLVLGDLPLAPQKFGLKIFVETNQQTKIAGINIEIRINTSSSISIRDTKPKIFKPALMPL